MKNKSHSPSAAELFEDWISTRENASYDPLSREAAVPYRYIWKRWCDWLQEQTEKSADFSYLHATVLDVKRFLQYGSTPASGRKSASTPTSPVTRERYGRVLRELYQHAINFGYMDSSNPVTNETFGVPPTEIERGGQILPPKVFEALYQILPNDPTPYEKRDCAIMLILMECALAPGELRQLKLCDISEAPTLPGQYLLHLDGPRAAQERDIFTTGPAGPALQQWLIHRTAMQRKTDVIFISEKRGPMTRRALFGLVAKMITRACQQAQVEVPNHIGPMVIRNHCIVRWFKNGKSVADICRIAGFKDEKSFMRGLQVHLR